MRDPARRTAAVAVPPGDLRVAGDGTVLAALGVGSCVVVALWDAGARVGGLAHPLLPEPVAPAAGEEGRFASTALPWLLELMRRSGAVRARIRASIAGGASLVAALSEPPAGHVGPRNLEAVREALRVARVPIDGEDVGGVASRSIYLDTGDGSVTVVYARGGRVRL
jgi:chemotaxis protein CheD